MCKESVKYNSFFWIVINARRKDKGKGQEVWRGVSGFDFE